MSIAPCGASVGPNVRVRNLEGRRRRVTRGLRRLVDLGLRFLVDAVQLGLADAHLQEPLAVTRNRVFLEPFLNLFVGAVLARVGARMAAVAVGLRLDEARAAALARELERALCRAVDDVDVVAVD